MNADTGAIEWKKKLSNVNIHASPFYADGLIYCSFPEGKLVVVKPGDKDAEIVQEVKLEGQGLGSPIVCNGLLYVHTTAKLYCFKINNSGINYDAAPLAEIPKAGPPAALQIIPSEFILHPGDKRGFKIRSIDANGFIVADVPKASWESFIPPTAKVKATLDGKFNDAGEIVAEADRKTVRRRLQGHRRRHLRHHPRTHPREAAVRAGLREVRADRGTSRGCNTARPTSSPIRRCRGSAPASSSTCATSTATRCSRKNFDRLLFQRATVFIGTADMSNYTVSGRRDDRRQPPRRSPTSA